MKKTVLIFGYGYSASFIAEKLITGNYIVFGTSRKAKINQGFNSLKVNIVKYDYDSVRAIISQITHIIISIPPDENGDIVYRDFKDIILLAKNIQWIGYLSSNTVYGNHDGMVVTEESELKYLSIRAANRVLAETQWQNFANLNNINLNIFRLAGIYGLGRNVFDTVKNGTAKSIYKKNHVFSRIHVQDIAQIIAAAINTDYNYEIYNLADDEPCSTIDVNNYAAKLLNIDPPEIINFADAGISEMIREFYADNKRVANNKIKNKLGIKLLYSNYRVGLDSIFENYLGAC